MSSYPSQTSSDHPGPSWEPGRLLQVVQPMSNSEKVAFWVYGGVSGVFNYMGLIPVYTPVVFVEFSPSWFAIGGAKIIYGDMIGWIDVRNVEPYQAKEE